MVVIAIPKYSYKDGTHTHTGGFFTWQFGQYESQQEENPQAPEQASISVQNNKALAWHKRIFNVADDQN